MRRRPNLGKVPVGEGFDYPAAWHFLAGWLSESAQRGPIETADLEAAYDEAMDYGYSRGRS